MTQFSSQITQASSAAGEWLGTEPDEAAVERERLERLRKKRLKMVQENPPPASVQEEADEETRQLWANYTPATSSRPSRPAPAPPTPRGSVGRQLSQQSMRPKSPDHPPPGYGGSASSSAAASANVPQPAVPGPAAADPPAAVVPPAAVNPPAGVHPPQAAPVGAAVPPVRQPPFEPMPTAVHDSHGNALALPANVDPVMYLDLAV